jgi:hypothetical protein
MKCNIFGAYSGYIRSATASRLIIWCADNVLKEKSLILNRRSCLYGLAGRMRICRCMVSAQNRADHAIAKFGMHLGHAVSSRSYDELV